jgi:hypothetical protein
MLLAGVREGGRADPTLALAALAPDPFSGKHAVLLSDLYGDLEAFERGLERLTHAGAALSILHVLDRTDRHLPPGATTVRDVETGDTRGVLPREAQAMAGRVEAWQRALRERALAITAEWVSVDAATPPGVALRQWLGGRR